MSIDHYHTGYNNQDNDAAMPPESEYNNSSEGVGGLEDEEDNGDEVDSANSQNSEKVGCRLGLESMSKASD
jgi:hypothetical protein